MSNTYEDLLFDLKNREECNFEDWSKYVYDMNKIYGKDVIGYELINDAPYDSECYCCSNIFLEKMTKVQFRYDPHKATWVDQPICDMCLNALQNKSFVEFFDRYEADTNSGYPGVLVYDDKNDWWYKDLRDLSGTSYKYQNLDYDPKIDGACENDLYDY
jgi:hypothetical protein